MIALLIVLALIFVWAVLSTAGIIVARANLSGKLVAKQAELDTANKMGKWYQDRVNELEGENRQLAEQIVGAGAIPRIAMPIPSSDPYEEYAYDGTGLIRETLDSRDLPIG